jgi:hypothetical protein
MRYSFGEIFSIIIGRANYLSSTATLFFYLNQGDQIGRIFAFWVIVYFEQFFENYKNNPNFCAAFFP